MRSNTQQPRFAGVIGQAVRKCFVRILLLPMKRQYPSKLVRVFHFLFSDGPNDQLMYQSRDGRTAQLGNDFQLIFHVGPDSEMYSVFTIRHSAYIVTTSGLRIQGFKGKRC